MQISDIEDVTATYEEPFYLRSKFGRLAVAIRDKVLQMNRCNAAESPLPPRNEYKSDLLFNYAPTHIFPYAPILNQAVFKVFGQTLDDDTTNNVEQWINILKNLYFQGEKNMRPGRLARSHEKLIRGMLSISSIFLSLAFAIVFNCCMVVFVSGSIAQAISAIRAYSQTLPGGDVDEDSEADGEIFTQYLLIHSPSYDFSIVQTDLLHSRNL